MLTLDLTGRSLLLPVWNNKEGENMCDTKNCRGYEHVGILIGGKVHWLCDKCWNMYCAGKLVIDEVLV